MGPILIVILALIIIYNLYVNLTNITIIIKYCIANNSVSEFWSLYFKHCFSFRAIYSSVFGLVISILLFFILIPIVLIRKYIFKKEITAMMSNGLVFEYKNTELPQGTWFYSNVTDFGFDMNKINATGNVAEDMENVLNCFLDFAKTTGKEINFDFMKEMYLAENDKTAIAPLLIRDDSYNNLNPVYLLYNDDQINQYKKVKGLLAETRYKDSIYFSVKNF